MGRVVLVTGVSRYLGARVAKALSEDPTVDQVVGVDLVPPAYDIGRTQFRRVDIRNPAIGTVLMQTRADTVVHGNVIATPLSAGGRATMKEINVLGTMQLLAACQRTPHLRHVVVKSTAGVYGSSASDPAMFTEDSEPLDLPRSGFSKDSVEVEGYVRGFARRRPGVSVTVFRFANIIGPGVDTTMTQYLSMPLVPTVLGFDARLQFCHEDDAVGLLARSAVDPVPGTYNVAGDGVLLLSQALRRLGKLGIPVPLQLFGPLGDAIRRSGLADFSPDQVRFLSYGRVLYTTRLVTRLRYRPAFTTAEAFADFADSRPVGGPLTPEVARAGEQLLGRLLGRLVAAPAEASHA